MKKVLLLLISVLIVSLFACARPNQSPDAAPATAVATQVVVPQVIASTAVPTFEPLPTVQVIVPTVAPVPTAVSESRQRIRAVMESYGQVDEKYLSDAYWAKMDADIATYGPAKRILTLEFHGDDYFFYKGSYSMTQEAFISQMDYLMANNYHFVTIPETLGFLEGWLQLPARSIILTTDSGAGSMNSMPRIIADFQLLEAKYGYTPHMQSYIWSQGMSPDESLRCANDICWQSFRTYRDSGYFTFGSHTEYHTDFSKMTKEETDWDLTTNTKKIRDNLGLNVISLTWPFEACSPFPKVLAKVGIKFAFGGWTRGILQDYTYQNDDMPLCLPRLFPPNPDGFSGRPDGKTFPEMLDQAVNQYKPLH